jgi:hypothetical protein
MVVFSFFALFEASETLRDLQKAGKSKKQL